MKKKIAIVCSGHVPSQFAHSINTVKHTNAFSELGYNVELLTVQRFYEKKNLKKINIFSFYGIKKLKIKFFKDQSIFYYQDIPFFSKLLNYLDKIFHRKIRSFRDPEKNISNYIKNNCFDFCYARSYRVVKFNILNKVPTIIEVHTPRPEENKELMETLKYSTNKYFKGLVTIHKNLKNKFVKIGVPENKIIVQEDAVDIELFNKIEENKRKHRNYLNIPIKKKIVMYSGSLKPGKGIHIILETAMKLESFPNILFYIIGGNKKEIKYWSNYKSQKYKNVIFVGFVQGSKIPFYLKSSDILFMPYDISEKNPIMDFKTTSPIKLFEYMASKKPILSTNIEVISKVLRNYTDAILVNQNYDIEILKLLNNAGLSKTISHNAFLKAKRYTYKNRITNILNAFYK